MTEMCKKAGLAHIYTPHCIRATSVTFLKAAGLENCRVKSVTGHASDKLMESYSARQTIESSAIVSRFITKQLLLLKPFGLWQERPRLQFNETSRLLTVNVNQHLPTVNVNPSSAPDFTHSVFHGCNFLFQSSQ